MKKLEILIISILGVMIVGVCYPTIIQAQAPQSIAYQAIVRDTDGDPLTDQLVSFQMTLHLGSESGTVVYCETHATTTSPLGLVNLQIGTGTVVLGSFLTIEWGSGLYYLEVELDPAGGTSYVALGTTQLISVPYALFSEETAQTYSAGTGIDITDHTITNTAPDQVVSLTPGSGITVGGTYPSFTVTNAASNATHTGDATGSGALTVVQIQGRPVSITAPALNQVLQWNGTQWQPSTISGGGDPAWLLTGNSGTNPMVNFLGTIDNQPIKFKVNNVNAGEINPSNNSTFLGPQAGFSSTGNSNVAIGVKALFSNTDRGNLVAIGDSALYNNGLNVQYLAQATQNTAIGSKALYNNTTGYRNTAVGDKALYSNYTGSYNTAVGVEALRFNNGGICCTAIGNQALKYNLDGSANTAVGENALHANGLGQNNTACGANALMWNDYGDDNTAIGCNALYFNGIGDQNTAIGYNALRNNQLGSYNTAVGYGVLSIASEVYLTGLGHNSNVSAAWISNSSVLGSNAIVNAGTKVRIGSTDMTVIEGQVDWSYPSDSRFKCNVRDEVKGLDFIMKLHPVVYNFDTRKYTEFLTQNMPDSLRNEYLNNSDFTASTAIRHSGFVAQEVEAAAVEVGYDFDGVHTPATPVDNYSVSPGQFVVPLVKAMQEQQAMIEELQKINVELLQRVSALEAQAGRK